MFSLLSASCIEVLGRLSAFERIEREAAVETLEDQGLGEFVQQWMNSDQDCHVGPCGLERPMHSQES